MPKCPELLSPEELAAYLKVPRRTLYQWRHRGVGPPAFRIGKHLRYCTDDVDRWRDEQQAVQA